jgi:heme exporter protein B
MPLSGSLSRSEAAARTADAPTDAEVVRGPVSNAAVERPESWFDQAKAVLLKDLRAELRNRAALNSILLFSITTLVVVGFSVSVKAPPVSVKAALLWVVLFFAAFSGLSHVFIHEEESGTVMALRLAASPAAVYAGKLAFNLLLLGVIALVVVPAFFLMLSIPFTRPALLFAVLAGGCLGLGAAATIVAAIIAKARGKGALYGALGFPILLPLLFIALHGTLGTMAGAPTDQIVPDVIGLYAFGIMLITASAVLFPYIWED